MSSGSVNLERIHRYDGGLGIGAHCVSDDGNVGYLGRDPITARTYRLTRLMHSAVGSPENVVQRAGFSLESVQRAACASDASWSYLITDHDIYFILQNENAAKRSSLQVRHGDTFLDLQVAGGDQRRTAVALTQDRASTSFTVTLLDSPDDSGSLSVVWSKTWGEPVLAVAISADGTYVAAAHQNGNITLLDRHRRSIWVYASADESPVIAVTVDNAGSVVALDSGGAIKRHGFEDGAVIWRLRMPIHHPDVRANLPAALLTVDSQTKTILCAVNRSEHLDDLRGSYVYMNGRNGEVLWDDQIETPITGIAISPNGNFSAISSQNGEVMVLSVTGRSQKLAGGDGELASQLLDRAQRAYNNHNFAKAVRVLLEVFALDPAILGIGQLYDDATWHLREGVMKRTTAVSPESLAKVEEALFIMPFDERLTIRRNALARLLAENLGREASECMVEGRLDDAIAKLREALTIDRSQSELRNSLRIASDQFALALIKEADVAFHNELFEEAIDMLERVQELRPGESAIGRRLDHAKGLHAYAIGMTHYIGKRYPEAAFWFRKTLSLMPEHGEAARYLAFADKFGRQLAVEEATSRPSEMSGVAERFNALAFDDLPQTSNQAPDVGPGTVVTALAPAQEPAIQPSASASDIPIALPPADSPADQQLTELTAVAQRGSLVARTTPPIPPTGPTAPASASAPRVRPTTQPGAPRPTGPSSPTRPSYWK